MALDHEVAVRPFLFDRDFWCAKLAYLRAIPRRLLIVPRPELSRPGFDVMEIKLRSHDGERLAALVARSAFGCSDQPSKIRLLGPDDLMRVRWSVVEQGQLEACFRPLEGRRLEDRVLDLLRVIDAIRSLEDTSTCVELAPESRDPLPDDVWIAEQVLATCGQEPPEEE